MAWSTHQDEPSPGPYNNTSQKLWSDWNYTDYVLWLPEIKLETNNNISVKLPNIGTLWVKKKNQGK